jgi:hypothetical protein
LNAVTGSSSMAEPLPYQRALSNSTNTPLMPDGLAAVMSGRGRGSTTMRPVVPTATRSGVTLSIVATPPVVDVATLRGSVPMFGSLPVGVSGRLVGGPAACGALVKAREVSARSTGKPGPIEPIVPPPARRR